MSGTKDDARKKLSTEDFEKLKKRIMNYDNEFVINQIILLKEHYGVTKKQMSQLFEIEESALDEEFKDEFGITFSDISLEKFFKNISKAHRELLDKMNMQITSSVTKEEISNAIVDGKVILDENSEIFVQYQKEIEEMKYKIYELIGKSDLSEVSPDSFFNCEFLEKINLENTGARLDMKKFESLVAVVGSIKGCELISFNERAYRTTAKKRTFGMRFMGQKK